MASFGTQIPNGAVTTPKLADGAVTAAKLAAGAIAASLGFTPVSTADGRLSDQRVPVDGSVSAAKLAASAISDKLGFVPVGQAAVDAGVALGPILAPASSTRNVIQPTGPAVVPVVLKGAASQSAVLLQAQDSAGTPGASMGVGGFAGQTYEARDAGTGTLRARIFSNGTTGYAEADVYRASPAGNASTTVHFGEVGDTRSWIFRGGGVNGSILLTPSGADMVRAVALAANQRPFATTLFAAAATVTNVALTGNVATITTAAAHGFTVGQRVRVAAVDATFNGDYRITSTPTTTTFTYARTNADVPSAPATGTATSQTHTQDAIRVQDTFGNNAFRVLPSGRIDTALPDIPLTAGGEQILASFAANTVNAISHELVARRHSTVSSGGWGSSEFLIRRLVQGGTNGVIGITGHADDTTIVSLGVDHDAPIFAVKQALAASKVIGRASINNGKNTSPIATLGVIAASTTDPVIVARGLASHSGPLTAWQDSAGATVASVSAGGAVTAAGVTSTAAISANNSVFEGYRSSDLDALRVRNTSQPGFSFLITAQGRHAWGPGDSTYDTTLRRVSAGVLEMPLTRWASGNVQTTVGPMGAAQGLPLTPTKYLKVVDDTGTTLVIPAYAAA